MNVFRRSRDLGTQAPSGLALIQIDASLRSKRKKKESSRSKSKATLCGDVCHLLRRRRKTVGGSVGSELGLLYFAFAFEVVPVHAVVRDALRSRTGNGVPVLQGARTRRRRSAGDEAEWKLLLLVSSHTEVTEDLETI